VLRFHLDEHVDPAIALGLRRRGIDVTTTTDAGLLGASDDEHLDFALNDSRVVFTNDADFLRIAARGRGHAGVAFCARGGSRTIGYIVLALAFFSDSLEPAEMANRIEYL